jgi:hypothetical protein
MIIILRREVAGKPCSALAHPTDLSKFLAHYQANEIKDLTSGQCAEAVHVLTLRKNANKVSP